MIMAFLFSIVSEIIFEELQFCYVCIYLTRSILIGGFVRQCRVCQTSKKFPARDFSDGDYKKDLIFPKNTSEGSLIPQRGLKKLLSKIL